MHLERFHELVGVPLERGFIGDRALSQVVERRLHRADRLEQILRVRRQLERSSRARRVEVVTGWRARTSSAPLIRDVLGSIAGFREGAIRRDACAQRVSASTRHGSCEADAEADADIACVKPSVTTHTAVQSLG